MDFFERFWEQLLSADVEQIAAAWHMLPQEYRADVRDHLCRMVMEEGWLPQQVQSAQAALDVIDTLKIDRKQEDET